MGTTPIMRASGRASKSDSNVDVRGANIAVIGSGGAAQTAYYYLVSHGARSHHVYHRSPASLLRFGSFVRRLPRPSSYRPALLEEAIDDLGGCDLCINCTPAPITDLVEAATIKRIKRIFELRYGNYDLVKRAHLRGNYMLAVQAVRNFKIMTGQEVTVNRVLKIIERSVPMIRFLTAGESHGPALTAIIEGIPAGMKLDGDAITIDLRRRQMGYGRGGRMRIETGHGYRDCRRMGRRDDWQSDRDLDPKQGLGKLEGPTTREEAHAPTGTR